MHACTHSGFHHWHPPRLPLPSNFNWHITHLLALCHYHHSSPINSKLIFHGKPCQNRHAFEIFSFFVHWACTHTTCTTHPLCHHLGQLLAHLCTPLCTLVCPQSTLHAPSTHPCALICTPFSGLVTHI